MATSKPYKSMVRNKKIEYEGHIWHIDAKAFYSSDGKGTLRVYRVHGDINHPHLMDALQIEAQRCAGL